MPGTWIAPPRADLVVAGAGIVGLAIAWEATNRGLSVIVVERDARPVGASVRNFGHGCLTAQTGISHEYAVQARKSWLQLRDEAGLWVRESGAVVAARTEEELAVVNEFAAANPASAFELGAAEVEERIGFAPAGLLGGLHLPDDIRVDPRTAAPDLAAHLNRLGVDFHLETAAHGVDAGVLHTSRGDIHADHVALALGHELDLLLPEPCGDAGLQRCQLHMLRVEAPDGLTLEPALLTGTSLLRYDGFRACPSSDALRSRIESDSPDLLAVGLNLMCTQAPNGDLIVGDTHVYEATPSPFASEELDDLLLTEATRLFGVPLRVKERWLGVYGSTPTGSFLTPTPIPGVVGVAVTSGIGMTTALGLAPAVLDHLLDSQAESVPDVHSLHQ